jgi:hypothetical protein
MRWLFRCCRHVEIALAVAFTVAAVTISRIVPVALVIRVVDGRGSSRVQAVGSLARHWPSRSVTGGVVSSVTVRSNGRGTLAALGGKRLVRER